MPQPSENAAPVGRLIVGGKDIPTPFPVKTWKDAGGLSFYAPDCAATWMPRRAETRLDLFVLHWDACQSSSACYRALKDRRLSVHLMLDADGTVYQALDLLSATAYHVAGHNSRSVGVEICNPVYRTANSRSNPRPVASLPRINGSGALPLVLDYYPVQTKRVVELAEAVCSALNIPKALPRAPAHPSRHGADKTGVPLGILQSPGAFRGVAGHYHLSEQKTDPGTMLWPALSDAGWK